MDQPLPQFLPALTCSLYSAKLGYGLLQPMGLVYCRTLMAISLLNVKFSGFGCTPLPRFWIFATLYAVQALS